ncbi:MAG: N-formylglutamate amidohydrolase, partial [Acidobacteriota bacterium]
YSRLLVDLNRAIGNSRLIRTRSDGHQIPFNRGLSTEQIGRRIVSYYEPYRQAVSEHVAQIVERYGRCVHLCVHTFTPVLQGKVRGNDVGLLYDPSRHPEAELARALRQELAARTGLTVWLNRPYQGPADGILPRIREAHPAHHYLGIELEINQRFASRPEELGRIAEQFSRSLQTLASLREWA